MSAQLERPNYLLRWDFNNPQLIGRDIVSTSHRLSELPIGTDSHLESLLQSVPRDHFSVSTSSENVAHPTQQQVGSLGTASVVEALDIIRRERLSMIVRRIDLHDAQMAHIADRLASELRECHVGLRVTDPHLDIHIASPGYAGYFSCDPQPSACLQLRGQLRVWVYPCTELFLNQQDFERIVHHDHTQPLYYEPAFDHRASVKVVSPGQMLAWPHPSPYRIEAYGGLSVTLKLTYQSCSSRRLNNVHLVNRVLRRLSQGCLCDDRTNGFVAGLKNSYAELMRLPESVDRCRREPSFVLDSLSPSRTRNLNKTIESQSSPGIVAAGINTLNTPASIVALEN